MRLQEKIEEKLPYTNPYKLFRVLFVFFFEKAPLSVNTKVSFNRAKLHNYHTYRKVP